MQLTDPFVRIFVRRAAWMALAAFGVTTPLAAQKELPWRATVVLFDLSQSRAGQCQEARATTAELVSSVTGGSILVLGITEHSWAQNLVLLRDSIPSQPSRRQVTQVGARERVRRSFVAATATLKCTRQDTDIVGALQLAALHVQLGADVRIIVISDGRNSTRSLRLERRSPADLEAMRHPVELDLGGAFVCFATVQTTGVTYEYHRALERFWARALEASNGRFGGFSLSADCRDSANRGRHVASPEAKLAGRAHATAPPSR